MTTGKIDISNLDEDELEDLMARLAVAKQQQRDKRTPEPYSPPQRRREFVTENNDKHRSGRRQEPLTAAPVRTADKISAMEDSDSDEIDSLESFFNLYVKTDLPDEEWLFVPVTSRRTDPNRRMTAADWLRRGSEDELYNTTDYNSTRRYDYPRNSSPVMSRYKSPQQSLPRSQSPLSRAPDMESVDIFKLGTRPSRYMEKVERRSLSSPPCVTPPPPEPTEPQRDYRGTSSPMEHLARQSPDWDRDGAGSPTRGIDQMTGHRYSPQAPATRYVNAIPTRETPSPKLSAGQISSPLERMNLSGYQRGPPTRGDSPGLEPRLSSSPVGRVRREPSPAFRTTQQSPGLTNQQTRMPVRPGIARPQIRAPQAGGLRPPRSLQPPQKITRSNRNS